MARVNVEAIFLNLLSDQMVVLRTNLFKYGSEIPSGFYRSICGRSLA